MQSAVGVVAFGQDLFHFELVVAELEFRPVDPTIEGLGFFKLLVGVVLFELAVGLALQFGAGFVKHRHFERDVFVGAALQDAGVLAGAEVGAAAEADVVGAAEDGVAALRFAADVQVVVLGVGGEVVGQLQHLQVLAGFDGELVDALVVGGQGFVVAENGDAAGVAGALQGFGQGPVLVVEPFSGDFDVVIAGERRPFEADDLVFFDLAFA